MDWLDRLLFPNNRTLQLVAILSFSVAFSYLLTGNQISKANWGVIDDHEVFSYLGPDLHLPAGKIWSTLIEKTEVGQLQGRFRPVFYLLKVSEASLFGPDVHLWYLVNTVCFAFFLASVWWTISRFVGVWLGGPIVAWIALLPLWSDVWSRLGPSEIFGAAAVAAMILGADLVFFSRWRLGPSAGAILLTVAAVALAGLKETFLPLALFGPAFVFALARTYKRLSTILILLLTALVLTSIASIAFMIVKEVRSMGGADYYGKSAGPSQTILFAIVGTLEALSLTWWLWVLPIVFFRLLKVLPNKPLTHWITLSCGAFAIYLFFVAMYAAQCGVYRMLFPHNSRYDFPAMLLVPAVCCLILCELSSKLRDHFPDRTIKYAQLAASVFWIFALVTGNLKSPPALAVAVKKNIDSTNSFFHEVERVARAAQQAPVSPVVLDAHGPRAYEPVLSVMAYLRALGVHNAIAVRFTPEENTKDNALYSGLERTLVDIEHAATNGFTPLTTALSDRSKGCLSVGLLGPPDNACTPFQINLQISDK
ncbi:hypothetical protein [Bradyrhizobium sp. CCGUVB23]|uniref:hypothetical protein n=1 Tax=Bradyrhizobium sp. CCGUVB23 TaxID=2949630 RepID=UPI0020B3C5E6|nr:hypothetical protein [Bradyrhizobium sp. CCGUVB23]MCP3464999.1 hypothetical protein [Bradyrhizobium sp. CCGUVB23]